MEAILSEIEYLSSELKFQLPDDFKTLQNVYTQRFNLQEKRPLWVGIVGCPGAGKSLLSESLCRRLSNVHNIPTCVIPMDGYHYYKKELDTMEDSHHMHARRGAIFTFNGEKFLADLRRAKECRCGTFPSFDHSLGDPIEGDIQLNRNHDLVIVEGNYLLSNELFWRDVKSILDIVIFINTSEEVYMTRLISRHMAAFKISRDDALSRVNSNDKINAEYIMPHASKADIKLEYI